MVLLVLLISTLAFGLDTLSGGLVRSYTRTISSLAWRAASGVIGSIDRSGILRTRSSLAGENNSLKAQVAERDEEFARLNALESENAMLSEMVHLVSAEKAGLSVRVLSSFHSSPYGTFIIGVGKNDGVGIGSIILTPGGFVLGTVTDVDVHTATVEELFAPMQSVDLIVHSVAFSAQGRGGGNAKAEVPRDAKVAIGDTAIAPAFGGRVAGVIGSIESASSSATQTLFIRIPVNLDTLQFVYVVK